jgi:peptide/nickel transport system substrate-binding protein
MLSRRGLAATAVATAIVPRPARANTKELRFRLVEDPEMLWGGQSVSLTVNTVIATYLVERLVYLGTDGTPQPWLAESWSFSEDAKQITFRLRGGVKFHDGTDLDSAAVKFQFDTILDPARASPVRPIVAALDSVDALDPLSVRFNFSRPFAPFMTIIGGGAYGINSPAAVQRLGRQYGRRPVGTGPYRFVSWTPGSEIVLERNPTFRQLRADALNKGAPYADRITLSVIPEEGVAFSALMTRELSAAELQTDTVERLSRDRNFRIVIDENAKNLSFLEFAFRAPFDDPRMREAVTAAIDRAAVVRAAYAGYAVEVAGPMARGIPGYDEAVAREFGIGFDRARARALLAELGWADPGRRGVLSKDGRDARFQLRSYANPAAERALAVIQQNLAEVGIQVSITTSDWGSFYPSLLRDGWDINFMRWTSSDPFVLVQLFRHPGHRRALPKFDGLDDALAGVETTLDPARRQVFVSEAQKLLLLNRAIAPLLTNHNLVITQAALQNYVPDALNLIRPGDLRMANW